MSVRTGVDEYNQPISDINSGYIGEFKYFGFESVPPHCLACDGSEVSRETYSELFAVFGTTFGAGDGVSTFNLPDLRGAFLRCVGGNAAELGTAQGDAIRNITGHLGIRPLYTSSGIAISMSAFTNGASPGAFNASSGLRDEEIPGIGICGVQNISGAYINLAGFDASRVVPTAEENRPINYAVNVCVVFE